MGCITTPDSIKVDLSAWPTRTLIAHLPEVLLAPIGEDSLDREEAEPDGLGLLVSRQALGRVSSEVGGVETLRGELVDRSEKLPGPRDCLLFEITEWENKVERERISLCYAMLFYGNGLTLQRTSYQASRKRCDGKHPFQHHRGRCACRQRECTFGSCRHETSFPCRSLGRQSRGRLV